MYGVDVLDMSEDIKRDKNVQEQERKKEQEQRHKDELLNSIFKKDASDESFLKSQSDSTNDGLFSNLVIDLDSSWKSAFDVVMLISSCYNTFSQAYYAAFGNPTNFYQNFLDYFIEVLFMLDFIFCFC